MPAAGLLVAFDDGLRRGVQKQHPTAGLHGFQLVQHVEELRGGAAGPHIVHQGHPLIAAAGPGTELREFQDHGGGHVVDDIKTHILQIGGRLALAPSGEAGDDQNVHMLPLSVSNNSFSVQNTNLRLQADAGLRQHPLPHLADQLQHIVGGGSAPVDEKTRVLFADLGAAYRQAF